MSVKDVSASVCVTHVLTFIARRYPFSRMPVRLYACGGCE